MKTMYKYLVVAASLNNSNINAAKYQKKEEREEEEEEKKLCRRISVTFIVFHGKSKALSLENLVSCLSWRKIENSFMVKVIENNVFYNV